IFQGVHSKTSFSLAVSRPLEADGPKKILKACGTLRIVPSSSPSLFPQPTRERRLLSGQVFWLTGTRTYSPRLPIFCGTLSTCHAFRQWLLRVSSPFTAAGPRGYSTLFPLSGDIISETHSMRACGVLSRANQLTLWRPMTL